MRRAASAANGDWESRRSVEGPCGGPFDAVSATVSRAVGPWVPGRYRFGASLAGYVVDVGAVSLSYSAPALRSWM